MGKKELEALKVLKEFFCNKIREATKTEYTTVITTYNEKLYELCQMKGHLGSCFEGEE